MAKRLVLLLAKQPLWQQFQNWYKRLAGRDRSALQAMVIVATIGLGYWLAWSPLNSWSTRQYEAYSKQLDTMKWMQQHIDRVMALEKKNRSTVGQKELASIVTNQARRAGVTISRIQPDKRGVAVWLEDAAYQKLLSWLVMLNTSNHVNVQQIKINRLKEEGRVKGYVHLGTG